MTTDDGEHSLSRRRFVQGAGVAGLGLLAGCGALPWQASQPSRVPIVGMLLTAASLPSAPQEAFQQGLQDLGYAVGENITLEYRLAEGKRERLPALAAELVQRPVNVIVTGGTPAALAAKEATGTIPIVMGGNAATDPVADGLVAGLARPGGNITGVSELAPQLIGKRLELLKETIPGLRRVAVLRHPSDEASLQAREEQQAAQALALQLFACEVRDPDGLGDAFETIAREGGQALLLHSSTFILSHQAQVMARVTQSRLPTMSDQRTVAVAAGLMSYGGSRTAAWRRAAYYVDRILKGAKPADLPVEQPTTFDFVINLQTAQALGLTIPPHVLLQATEVIQ